jgi:hypothetical protein
MGCVPTLYGNHWVTFFAGALVCNLCAAGSYSNSTGRGVFRDQELVMLWLNCMLEQLKVSSIFYLLKKGLFSIKHFWNWKGLFVSNTLQPENFHINLQIIHWMLKYASANFAQLQWHKDFFVHFSSIGQELVSASSFPSTFASPVLSGCAESEIFSSLACYWHDILISCAAVACTLSDH